MTEKPIDRNLDILGGTPVLPGTRVPDIVRDLPGCWPR